MIRRKIKIIYNVLTRYIGSQPLNAYYRSGGNRLLTEKLDITADSLVIDVGAFKGDWAHAISKKYNPSIHLWEPIPEYALYCKDRFSLNPKVTVIDSALGKTDTEVGMNLSGVASSLFNVRPDHSLVNVSVKSVSKYLECLESLYKRDSVLNISCLKLNFEGSEYEILDCLIFSGKITDVQSLLIQFHPWPDGFSAKLLEIRKALELTHELRWGFEMIWERWDRR